MLGVRWEEGGEGLTKQRDLRERERERERERCENGKREGRHGDEEK